MKAKVQNLLRNPSVRSASGTIIVYGFGAALFALSGFVLARILGPGGIGTYDFADAWVEILLPIAVLGLDRMLIRRIAVYRAQEQHELLRGVWKFSQKQSLVMSISLALGLSLFFFIWLGQARISFENGLQLIIDPSSQIALFTVLLAILVLLMRVRIRLLQATMQGLRYITQSLLPDFIIRLLVFMLFIGIYFAFANSVSAPMAMAFHLVGSLFALIVAEILIRRLLPDTMKFGELAYERKAWLQQSLQLALIASVVLATSRISTIFLGTFSTFEQTGFYSLALRITQLITLPQLAIASFIQPRIAKMYSEGDFPKMQRILVLSIRITLVIALSLMIPVWLGGAWVLSIFGEGFVNALPVLYIVSIGQLVSLTVGPIAPILMMTGYERDLIGVVLSALFIMIIFNFVLVPIYGAVGAAIATTVGLSLTNIGQFLLVRWRLKIWALPVVLK